MSTPKVSVVVPNYNYARYLPERIQSILNQTFQDFELILLDDASTDGSAELLDRWRSHPKVSNIVVNDTNSGSPFAQWERGIALARGEYIWIAEADDLAAPGFLSTAVAALDSHPAAAVAFSGCYNIDAEGKKLGIFFDDWKAEKDALGEEFFSGLEYVRHNMYWANYIYNASGALFRRNAFALADIEKARSMRNSGDWLVWSAMISRAGVVLIYSHLNRMRMHGSSQTDQGRASGNLLREDLEVIKHIEESVAVGRFRRHMRHGWFYKEIIRMKGDDETKSRYIRRLKAEWPDVLLSYWLCKFLRLFGFRPKRHDRL